MLESMKQTPQSFIHYYRPPVSPQEATAPERLRPELRPKVTATQPAYRPSRLKNWTLILGMGTLLGYAASRAWVNHAPDPVPAPPSVELRQEAARVTPSPTPAPSPPQWIPGTQYRVAMPDGRTILVNFKGWVDHACNLPRQPAGGANNAMYFDSATGIGWIWTVPVGPSNVPRWIDP
jgi:hypothetical protein